jgi:hypothetical protein
MTEVEKECVSVCGDDRGGGGSQKRKSQTGKSSNSGCETYPYLYPISELNMQRKISTISLG